MNSAHFARIWLPRNICVSDGLQCPQVADFRTASAQVNDQQIYAHSKITDTQLGRLFGPNERPRRAVEVADLARVYALLGRPEFGASRGAHFDTHDLLRRTRIDRDDVDLVFADSRVAGNYSPT